MSMRPREESTGRMVRAQSRMAPGGRRWSESPIPRVGRRRPRRLGEPGLACGVDYPRDAMGATSAHFLVADPDGYVPFITAVAAFWSAAAGGGLVSWRVVSLDPFPGDPPDVSGLPTAWVEVDTSEGSGVSVSDVIGSSGVGRFVGFTIEWDVSGGFSDVCARPSEQG